MDVNLNLNKDWESRDGENYVMRNIKTRIFNETEFLQLW
jgi:hypothetical protein